MPAKSLAKKTSTAPKTSTNKTTTKKVSGNVQATRKVESRKNGLDVLSSNQLVTFLKTRRKYLLFIAGSVLIIFLLYYYKQLFVVAIVNGQPISRLTYYQELEKQAGEQALNTIVTKMLVMQEAQKQHSTVSDEEIKAEIKSIEERLKSQGQSLDTLLLFQGLTREGLKEQLRLQKLAEKMAGKNITVSDKEIDDYLKSNPSTESAGANAVSSPAERNTAKDKVRQQKLSDAIQKWLESLRSKANIQRYVYFNTNTASPGK